MTSGRFIKDLLFGSGQRSGLIGRSSLAAVATVPSLRAFASNQGEGNQPSVHGHRRLAGPVGRNESHNPNDLTLVLDLTMRRNRHRRLELIELRYRLYGMRFVDTSTRSSRDRKAGFVITRCADALRRRSGFLGFRLWVPQSRFADEDLGVGSFLKDRDVAVL